MSCSLTLKSSRLVDLWVIPYCLPYCYAAGAVYSPVICMVRDLGSLTNAWDLFHPSAIYKLPATPAHRLCAEIHVRALRILSDIGSIAKNKKFPNFLGSHDLQITHSVNPASD